MKIYLDGWHFVIKDITSDEVRSLRRMIKSANLSERRDFQNLAEQIDDLEEKSLIIK